MDVASRPRSDHHHLSNNNNDDTQTTNSSQPLSDLSGISNEETDTLGRAIMEHARDRQRLQHATAPSNHVAAFSKARPRPRIALTMENLARNDATRRRQSSPGSHDSSGEVRAPAIGITTERRTLSENQAQRQEINDASDPSSPAHNVPMQWGRKARGRNDFLRRISASQASSPVKEVKQEADDANDEDRIYRRRTTYTGDLPQSGLDWSAEGAMSGPEDNRRKSESVRMNGQSGNSREENKSIEIILELEKEELPEDNSPTSNITSRRALSGPSFSKVEVADLAGRGLATSRLSAFGGGQTRRRGASKGGSSDRSNVDGVKESEEPGSLMAIKTEKPQPVHRREVNNLLGGRGARDLLRQLASSSHSGNSSPPSGQREKLPATRDTVSSLNRRARGDAGIVGSTLSPTHATFERSHSREAFTSGRSSRIDSAIVETRSVRTSRIDTEDNVDVHQSPSREHSRSRPSVPSHPSHPHSAAEELLQDPVANHLGDSTIYSLQDLLDANPDVDFSTVLPLDGDTLALAADVDKPLLSQPRPPATVREEESIAIQRMNDRLQAARRGLRDASRGIQRIEHQVEVVAEANHTLPEPETKTTADTRKSSKDRVTTTTPAGETFCIHCANREEVTLGKLVWRALCHFFGYFIRWPRGGWPRFTWLGLLWFLIVAWVFTENTLWYVPFPIFPSTTTASC